MKIKYLVALLALFACNAAAYAQSEGSFILSAGWEYFMPNSNGALLKDYTLNGTPVGQVPINFGMKAESASAFGLSGTYFITDNIAAELMLNTPARQSIKGTDDWAGLGKIASVKQWSPALLVKYYFGDATVKFRPFLGAGLTRVWFTNAHFTQKIDPSITATTLSLKNQWAPVLNGGLTYQFDERWFTSLAVSYTPLRPNVDVSLHMTNKNVIGAKAKLKMDQVSTFLSVGYRF